MKSRWLTILSLAVVVYVAAAATLAGDAPAPPPLTEQQIDQVRTLVKRTQAEQARLKGALAKSQEKLAECYTVFELDGTQVDTLQTEIVDLQRKLLASHHSMQTELRTIVGPERFQILSRRISNALRSPPETKPPTRD